MTTSVALMSKVWKIDLAAQTDDKHVPMSLSIGRFYLDGG